jgi:hypothetical protein
MSRFYTFKGAEEYYKQKYPEFVMLLLFNAFAVFVSIRSVNTLSSTHGFMETTTC